MAHKKGGGSAKNLKDSQPKFLGVKRADGQAVKTGEVLVRQRGTKIDAGKHVGIGKDHTLFALANGIVSFKNKRKVRFDGNMFVKKMVDIIPS